MKNMLVAVFITAASLVSSVSIAGNKSHKDQKSHEEGHECHCKDGQHLEFKNDIHAHIKWETGPKAGVEGVLKIVFKNAKTHKATDIKATPSVVLWMPSMGHGSSPTAIQSVVDDKGKSVVGTYRVSKIDFIMAGSWDVRVVLKHSDGTEETQSFPVVIEEGKDGHQH